jgi:hypothetical protein
MRSLLHRGLGRIWFVTRVSGHTRSGPLQECVRVGGEPTEKTVIPLPQSFQIIAFHVILRIVSLLLYDKGLVPEQWLALSIYITSCSGDESSAKGRVFYLSVRLRHEPL